MHCPECGQEILAGSEFCGNCGAPVTRQQAGPVCANCGSPNQPGAEFCAECGARLGGEVIPMQSFCPECGAAVKEGAAFCKECGADLNATTAPAPFVCPECGEPLPPDAAFCGNCGRVLQQGGEYVPAPATTATEYQPSYPSESQDYYPQQDWVQPQPQPQPQTQDWEYSQQQAQYPPQGQPQPPIQQQGWTQQPPQKSNRNKMLMAAAAAVILLVIGIIGFWKPGYLLDLFRPTAKLENGVLALKDITLDFKQTNLSNGAATMTTVKDKEEEVQRGLIGDLYVMKIDKSCQGKVTVSVPTPKGFKPSNENGLFIKLGIGRDYSLGDGKITRRYSYFDATVKDGKAVAVIDPAALAQNQLKFLTSAKPAEDKKEDIGIFTVFVGYFFKVDALFRPVPLLENIKVLDNITYGHVKGEGYQYTKGHFRVWYDYNENFMQSDVVTSKPKNVLHEGDMQNLVNDLEEAYNYYKTHGYKEHVDTYTPIDVYISQKKGKGEGNEGTWDPVTGNIEIEESKLYDSNHRYEGPTRTNVRATIYHEVFHAVQQSLIGSTAYITDSTKNNWFDEATGTYFEKLVSKRLSDNEQANFWLLWQGPIPSGSSKEEGYSRGPLIEYMSNKLGGDAWIKDCLENWSEDYLQLRLYMKKIATTNANFVANFYMELIREFGYVRDASWYYRNCQRPDKTDGQDRFLSAIRLELDAKAKEKIAKGEEDAMPVVFSCPSFELEGYGGRVIALVSTEGKNVKNTRDLTEGFPDKCRLKLEAEGECRIQILRFTTENSNIVEGNVIEKFKEQTDKGYKFLVLVTSTQRTKQNIVLKATLEKEDLKEGIYHGKATMTQGKKTATRNNVLGFRLSKLNDGRWGLNSCDKNGNYPGEVYNIPLTYDAKQQLWKGHRKLKENVSKNPNQPKIETATLDCTMKVNLEGKEPVLIIRFKTEGITWKWGYPTKEKIDIKFEGKWVSELKGRNLHAGKEGKVIILE